MSIPKHSLLPRRPADRQRPRSLTQQIRYGLPVFVVLSLLLTSGALIALSSQAQREQLVTLQRERSRAAAITIEAYLDDISRKLGYLARVQGLADMSPELQGRLLDALTRQNAAYELVVLADAAGDVTAGIAPYGAVLPAEVAAMPAFRRALRRQEDFIGPVEVDMESGLPVVTFGLPVRDDRDQVAGVLLARVSLEFLWFVVGQADVGDTGYTYVLDNRNLVVAEPGSSAESFRLTDLTGRPFVRALTVAPEAASLTYTGLYGEEVIGTSMRIRGVNWYVVAELPTAEVYAPLRRELQVLGAALGAALLLAVGAGFVFARRIVAPLGQLTQAAERISAGELDVRVAVSARNELGLLGATFNTMARRFQGLIGDLSASEHRFRAIFDQTFQFVALLTPGGRLLEVNQSGLELGGVAAQEVIGMPFWETPWWRVSSEAVEQLRASIALAALGEFVRYEVEVRGADGTLATLDFSLKPVLDPGGQAVMLIAEGRNVTDRKAKEQAERQLIAEQAARREAELARQRLALLAEVGTSLAASLERDTILERLVTALAPALGDWCAVYTLADGEPLRRVALSSSGDGAPGAEGLVPGGEAVEACLAALRRGELLRYEQLPAELLVLLAPDGGRPAAQSHGWSGIVVPIIAQSGLAGIISLASASRRAALADPSIVAEVARRAATALDNARLYHEAQQALRVRNEFLSIASHELRTPLTALLGNAQLLQRRAAGEQFAERDRRFIKVVGDQAIRLSRLIDALLDIARLERGQLTLQRERLELREIVERMLLELQPTLRNHTLAWTLGEQPLMVEADALRMEQVLQNLLSNAVKYSPEGGVVAVRAEVEDGRACISVSDQGIGIAPDALAQLFGRFYRAPNAEQGNIAGMGIGLYLVREIISLHGGEIAAHSVEGRGSTFTLSIPLYRHSPAPPSPEAAARP